MMDIKRIPKDGGPYPDENEPSDYLMISADLQLVRQVMNVSIV